MVSDEAEEYDPIRFYLTEAWASLKTDEYLIKEDRSLKTLWNFIRGRDYLNSRWTAQLHQENRLHIIYLAVSPGARHTGVAEILMDEVIRYSESHRMLISLETHNEKNLSFYSHFGFKTFGIRGKGYGTEAVLPGAGAAAGADWRPALGRHKEGIENGKTSGAGRPRRFSGIY